MSKEIRVLVLHPGNPDDPLCGTLQHVRLLSGRRSRSQSEPSRRDYEAISYAWGSPVWTSSIAIVHKGKWNLVPIQSSLNAALRYFRDST